MKVKKVNKKLVLNKTTVSNLNNVQLRRVVAGAEETVVGIATCDSFFCTVGCTQSCDSCDFSCVGFPCATDYCTNNCTETCACGDSIKVICP